MTFQFDFTADDDSLDPNSYSDGLVLGCVRLPFAGSLSSTCLHVCLGHGHPRKYGLHITDTWISNQSGIFIVSTPLTQIQVLKLIKQENLLFKVQQLHVQCIYKVLTNIDSSKTFSYITILFLN